MIALNSLWRCGVGQGLGDIQRVISTGGEIITVTEAADPANIRWSWLGPETDFVKIFVPFSHVIAPNRKRP